MIKEIIDDNLMTREQIIAYLKDDFRVDLQKIRSITLIDELAPEEKLSSKKIPHHRYNLFFNQESGALYIQATEGKLRTNHLKLETEFLSELIKTPVTFADLSISYDIFLQDWLARMATKLAGKKIEGVLIGSMWNFNFYLKFFAQGEFADTYTKNLNRVTLENYVIHQLALAVIEEEYIHGRLNLNEHERTIFQEGKISGRTTLATTKKISSVIPFFHDKIAILRKRIDLVDYIKTDFLFFSDLEDGTSLFKETLVSDMTEIIDDSFLSYQIIDVRNKTYINFSWANDEILSAAIKTLEQVFSFKSLYMYGKCGSLTPDLKIGQLVAPMQCSNGKKFVDIKNQMLLSNDTKAVNFIHVQSPLVETRTWARTMLSLGCNCVDMELDSVVRSISEKVTKKIIYYISDEPTMGLTLSDRLSMLKQRLDCSKKIIEDLLTDTVEHL